MKMKKVISLLLSASMAFSLCACGGGAKSEPAKESLKESEGSPASTAGGQIVNVGVPAGIPSLDPYFGTDLGALYVNSEIYEYLFVSSYYGGELEPAIGKEYTEEIVDDKLKVRVTLFDYVYDTAGNQITAEDVVFSYETAKQTGASTFANQLESATVIDDYTVELVFTDPVVGNWKGVAEQVWIVDKDAYDADAFSTNPQATGPYCVKEFVPGSYLTLKKNENYWQTDEKYLNPCYQQNIEEIRYKIILEAAQMTIALQTGDIDVACNVSSTELEYFEDENGEALDGYMVNSATSNLVNALIFNCSKESIVGQDQKLRQAICYAIDEAGLVDGAVNGEGELCHGWANGMEIDYNDKWNSEDYYSYNIEKAKELLAESSYVSAGSPTLRLMLQSNDEKSKAAVIIQGYLLAIGINSEILTYDAALFGTYKYEFDQWDMLLDNQSSTIVASNFMNMSYTSWNGEPCSFNGLHDEEFQTLYSKASSPVETSEENVDSYHEYLKEHAFVYGLWVSKTYQVGVSGIDSIFFSPKLFMVILPGAMEYADDYKSASEK